MQKPCIIESFRQAFYGNFIYEYVTPGAEQEKKFERD